MSDDNSVFVVVVAQFEESRCRNKIIVPNEIHLLLENKRRPEVAPEVDAVTDLAVRTRYSHLFELVRNEKHDGAQELTNQDPLSLSLPITPRTISGYPLDMSFVDTEMSKQSARELEAIENRINLDFIKRCAFNH